MQPVRAGQGILPGRAGALLPCGADHVQGGPARGHCRRLPSLARIVVPGGGGEPAARFRAVDRDDIHVGRGRRVDEQDRAARQRAAAGRGKLHPDVRGAALGIGPKQGRLAPHLGAAQAVDIGQRGLPGHGAGLRVDDEQDRGSRQGGRVAVRRHLREHCRYEHIGGRLRRGGGRGGGGRQGPAGQYAEYAGGRLDADGSGGAAGRDGPHLERRAVDHVDYVQRLAERGV